MINLLLICKMLKRKHFNVQCVCMINTNFKFVHVTTVTYTRRIEHGSVDLGRWSNWYILFLTSDNSNLWTSWKYHGQVFSVLFHFHFKKVYLIHESTFYYICEVGLPYMYRTCTCINYQKLLILIKTFNLPLQHTWLTILLLVLLWHLQNIKCSTQLLCFIWSNYKN